MNSYFNKYTEEGLHEECGVFGIYNKSPNSINSAYMCRNALLALQHRGQQSCGIAVNDMGVIDYYKDMGLVSEVFNNSILDSLNGQIAIAHTRYSTADGATRESAQPLVMRYIKGVLSIAHNGNITNSSDIRQELEYRGAIFQTNTDSEIISYVIARERINSKSVEEAVEKALNQVNGAYSLVIMSPRKLIAARDPNGFRPLCIGKIDDSIIFASETAALDACGADFIRDVEPGEIVVVDEKGMRSIKMKHKAKKALCVFEYIYFARSDSIVDNISVYEARKNSGRILAAEHPVEADLIIGVPDSGIDAAIGYSEESGIPFDKGIVKNNYIGRTFIQPTQKERKKSVKIKLNPLVTSVKGKRIVLIDDSIVRGTTCDRIVSMFKNAGAKEVHLRISSPPFMWPCYYGTNIPSKKELIACNYTIEEIGKISGADSIGYLPVESLDKMLKESNLGYCDACFTGVYPTDITKIKE